MRVELLMINQQVKDVLDKQLGVCSLNRQVRELEIMKMILKEKMLATMLPRR